jgi:hypothetical protein
MKGKVGTPCQLLVLPNPLPGPQWGQNLRRASYNGDPTAASMLAAHVLKWHLRKMPATKIAKRIGVPLVTVLKIISQNHHVSDLTPRLVKREAD